MLRFVTAFMSSTLVLFLASVVTAVAFFSVTDVNSQNAGVHGLRIGWFFALASLGVAGSIAAFRCRWQELTIVTLLVAAMTGIYPFDRHVPGMHVYAFLVAVLGVLALVTIFAFITANLTPDPLDIQARRMMFLIGPVAIIQACFIRTDWSYAAVGLVIVGLFGWWLGVREAVHREQKFPEASVTALT